MFVGAEGISSLIEQRDAIKVQADVDAFDINMQKTLGDGVMNTLYSNKADTLQTQSISLADMYINDTLAPTGIDFIYTDLLPKSKIELLINHMADKNTLLFGDVKLLLHIPFQNNSKILLRSPEFMSLLQPNDIDYYKLKNTILAPNNIGKTVIETMSTSEILLISAGIFIIPTYDNIRKELLARCISTVVKARRAAKQSIRGAEFDSAMEPIVTAINAPLLVGLPEAIQPYGVTITLPDYTDLIDTLTQLCIDIDQHKITSIKPYAGSLIFWKGLNNYTAWVQQYK